MSDLFVLQTPLAELVIRAAVIYFFLLIIMRVIGRHEFGQLTPFNLILLLIIPRASRSRSARVIPRSLPG
jgi:uncharacterized membrane protein YcaP (DUF421 family)